MNIVLQNCHIQAYVSAEMWNALQNEINEGGLYEVQNFYVKRAVGNFRPVHSNLFICFVSFTTIKSITADDVQIRDYKFEYVPLQDIFEDGDKYANDHTFSIGVAMLNFYLIPGF